FLFLASPTTSPSPLPYTTLFRSDAGSPSGSSVAMLMVLVVSPAPSEAGSNDTSTHAGAPEAVRPTEPLPPERVTVTSTSAVWPRGTTSAVVPTWREMAAVGPQPVSARQARTLEANARARGLAQRDDGMLAAMRSS